MAVIQGSGVWLHTKHNRFADGGVFVALQSVLSVTFLGSSIAMVVGCSLAGQNDPLAQLSHFLRPRVRAGATRSSVCDWRAHSSACGCSTTVNARRELAHILSPCQTIRQDAGKRAARRYILVSTHQAMSLITRGVCGSCCSAPSEYQLARAVPAKLPRARVTDVAMNSILVAIHQHHPIDAHVALLTSCLFMRSDAPRRWMGIATRRETSPPPLDHRGLALYA